MSLGRQSRVLGPALALAAMACFLFDDGELQVTAAAEQAVASALNPVRVTVTATNAGDSRAMWGRGSSTCQLRLLVRIGTTDFPALVPRPCTADLVDHALDPGESRTETLRWAGGVIRGDSLEVLEPGAYELRGAAGNVTSEPIHIELRGSPRRQ